MAKITEEPISREEWHTNIKCGVCGTGWEINSSDVFRREIDGGSILGIFEVYMFKCRCGKEVEVKDFPRHLRK